MKPENAAKLEAQEVDEDLPGLGQFYCIQCRSANEARVAERERG